MVSTRSSTKKTQPECAVNPKTPSPQRNEEGDTTYPDPTSAVDPDSESELSTMSDDMLYTYEALYGALADDDDNDDDEEEERPLKRVKVDEKDKSGDVAIGSALGQGSAPASTNQLFSTPPPSSPPTRKTVNPVTALTSNIARAANELPTLLSPTLPPGLEALIAARTRDAAPRTEEDAMKMIIVKKDDLNTLVSYNTILRSHNLNLAKQNTQIRQSHATTFAMLQQATNVVPLGQDQHVDQADYDRVVQENEASKREMARLRYEHEVMRQCGLEWARQEHAWETERAMLRTQVEEAKTCERGLMNQLAAEKRKLANAEQTVFVLGRSLEQEAQHAAVLQGEVDRLVASQPRSAYPEL